MPCSIRRVLPANIPFGAFGATQKIIRRVGVGRISFGGGVIKTPMRNKVSGCGLCPENLGLLNDNNLLATFWRIFMYTVEQSLSL